MATITVPTWVPTIVRGRTVSVNFTWRDETNALVTFDDAEIVVTPVGASPFTWTLGVELTLISPGLYNLTVSAATTAAYSWSSGTYRWNITLDGEANPCIMEGRIFVKDC